MSQTLDFALVKLFKKNNIPVKTEEREIRAIPLGNLQLYLLSERWHRCGATLVAQQTSTNSIFVLTNKAAPVIKRTIKK